MKTPYFLWDYNLSENQMRTILDGNNEVEKLWLIARIITHAKYDDIWRYVTLEDIVKVFPKLRLTPRERQNWQRAFKTWGYEI